MRKTRKCKKIVTALLAASLLAGLSGCGSGNGDGNTSTKTEETKAETTQVTETQEATTADEKDAWKPDDNKTYQYTWCFYQVAPIDKNPEMFSFYKDKFNIEFDVWDIEASQASELLANRIIGGEIPDRFEVGEQSAFKKYVEQGIVAEIPMKMLEIYAPNVLAAIERDVPGALEYCKVDGKLYGLPTYTSNISRAPVAWRMDWLKNVGIEKVPETIDEFEDAIYKLTFDDPDGNGKNDTYGISESALTAVYGAYGYIPYVNSQGSHAPGLWQDRDGHLVNGAVQPEMKEALTRIAKWYQDGVIDPEFVTGENQGGYWALSHSFINGRIGVSGMGQTYHWQPPLYEGTKPGQDIEELLKLNPDAEVALGVPPKGPYGQGTFANASVKEAKVVFGTQLEDEPDKLAKILSVYNWVYESKENHDIASNGIEGVNWNYEEKTGWDGKTEMGVVMTEEWSDNKVKSANFAHQAMVLFSPTWDVEEAATIRWQKSVDADKYRYSTQLFTALPSSALYQSELTSFTEETYFAIIAGTKPVDYFDTYVETWNSMGGSQLTQEADEWYQSVKNN